MTRPSEIRLTVVPRNRFQAINVIPQIADEFFGQYQQALFCSLHTTAGYLRQSVSTRLQHSHDLLHHFFRAFHSLFPQGAEYRHDRMELRTELSDDQKVLEPHNGDSHLTFMGAGMSNCATYRLDRRTPVYFIELDGTQASGDSSRERQTLIVGFDRQRVADEVLVTVPVSKHPIDSINLADPKLGVLDRVNEVIRRVGVAHARVDLLVDCSERNVGLTVNEYETLLIQNDLIEVLRNPLRFARLKGRHMIEDPLAIPAKTLSYAQYDAVLIMNSLMEAFGLDHSSFERLIAKAMSLPARWFFRSRRISFLAGADVSESDSHIIRGKYQSPILVQWKAAEHQARRIRIRITELS